ncbi:MAG: multiheme c-type cytochrome [Mucilaginibacter sp.]
MKKIKSIRLGIIFLAPLVFIFSHCFDNGKPADPRGDAYAGQASCLNCHKKIYQNYLHTAHFLTSRPAIQATIHGSFKPGSNTVVFNDSTKVVMEKDKDRLYQASYTDGKLKEKQRFDITFGSNRGETYLYWKGNEIYELPVTYYLYLHQWANSPGYRGGTVKFDRPMGKRCFECHSSYIENLPGGTGFGGQTEKFDKKSMMLNIDCERCHGPAANHVAFHTENPEQKKAMYITRISSLSRLQRIDLCGQCHAGNTGLMFRSIFDFKPGDKMADFKDTANSQQKNSAKIDVHGNQAGLLAGSKCFINGKIECATCHNIHDELKSVSAYSQRCTTCHSEEKHNFCKVAGQLGQSINNRCIDCHMPIESSNAIVIHSAGNLTIPAFQARVHRIAIYPEESQKIMIWLKASALGSSPVQAGRQNRRGS